LSDIVAPLHSDASHSLGKHKPPLEGGEEKRVQFIDASPKNLIESVINLQTIHECLFMKFADIFDEVPSELPLLREINHCIPLMEDGKRYYYHLPCCPDAMKLQLMDKLQQYIDSGW
jgi:hypothetical protein